MTRTKEQILEAILKWEEDNGESFTDYFDANMNADTFIFWCVGKGYITTEQYRQWEKQYRQKISYASDLNSYLYNEDNDPDVPYAIVITEEFNQEALEKAFGILAEFIETSLIYQERFEEFLTNLIEINYEKAVQEYFRGTRRRLLYVALDNNDNKIEITGATEIPFSKLTTARWYMKL